MKKKICIVTVPMLPPADLRPIRYQTRDGDLSSPTRFPGIALLEKHAAGKSPVKLVTVRTDDDNGRTEACYRFFHEELEQLRQRLRPDLAVDTEIVVPHNETGEKERRLLKDLFSCFDRGSYIYMDLTYGTKLTAVELFASLHYAEIVADCSVRSVVYGKYAFSDTGTGELFDATRLYHTVRFLDTAAQMDRASFADLLGQMLAKPES